MRFERDDARVGLLVFISLLLFVGLLSHRSIRALTRKENLVKVRLHEVDGLVAGTEVQIQGLAVGAVKAVELERRGVEYAFVATLGLRPDIQLWKGTKGLVVSRTFGGSYLDLNLPPVAERTRPLEAGDILEGGSAASLASLIAEVQGFVHNLDGALTELRGHLKARGLGSLIEHPQVRSSLEELRSTLEAYRKVAQHADGSLQPLDRGLASLEKSLAMVQQLLENRSGDLDATLRHLAATSKELEGASGQANELLRRGGPEALELMRALRRDLQSAQELLELLKAKPSRVLYGKPTEKEQEEARKKAEESRKQQEPAEARPQPETAPGNTTLEKPAAQEGATPPAGRP